MTSTMAITCTSEVEVLLKQSIGSDKGICDSARISILGNSRPTSPEKDEGLINYLMKKRHGSPFEHNSFTFYVKAPIFVFREFHRHRIGFSYNEMSGRYTELLPEFYIPAADRPLKNVGTSANPRFEAADEETVYSTRRTLEKNYNQAWSAYQEMLSNGVAKEVARFVLPVAIMSQMVVTCNARSLMAFLSLRTSNVEAMFISNPQHEIEMVAKKMEDTFSRLFPATYRAFNIHGRVAP